MTPMDKGAHLQDKESVIFENKKIYQALTGSLTYAAMSMCQYIRYITQFLSQVNKIPKQHNWNAAKRVLRYLKGTRNMGITFQRDPDTTHPRHNHVMPWGYCDPNYTKDACDQKSTSGYVFMLAGGLISWKSKKKNKILFCYQLLN